MLSSIEAATSRGHVSLTAEVRPINHFDWVSQLGNAIDAHVLIVGDGTLDLMCALIRSGCPGGSAVRLSERVPTEPVGVVLVPSVTNMIDAARALALVGKRIISQ